MEDPSPTDGDRGPDELAIIYRVAQLAADSGRSVVPNRRLAQLEVRR